MDILHNLCPNGHFEFLLDAKAQPLPQDWLEVRPQNAGIIAVSSDTFDGKWSLNLQTAGKEVVGLNSAVIPVNRGVVKFIYKAIQSEVQCENLSLFVIGLNRNGIEIGRIAYNPPKSQEGDNQWHDASLDFDFSDKQVRNCVVAIRINENCTHRGAGNWLINSVEVFSKQIGPKIKLAQIWADKPLAYVNDNILLSTFVENSGDMDSDEIDLEISTSIGLSINEPVQRVIKVPAGSFQRIDWTLKAIKQAEVKLQVQYQNNGIILEKLDYRILVLDKSVAHTRQEICTDEDGFWRLIEKPATLQNSNNLPLSTIEHLKSCEIKHNTYGICTHLPREKDYEDTFNPQHLIDGNPDTYWSSQQNSSAYPGKPPWVQVDFTRPQTITQVNLIPYWRNGEFPVGFSVQYSNDNFNWDISKRITNYKFDEDGPKKGDKIVQCIKLNDTISAKYIRIVFERLPLAGGNYAEVSQGYKARLSGVEIVDNQGDNIALSELGTNIRVSDVFTGWSNTAKTVNESFRNIMDIGLKWVRVGQWGDQTEWAAVEREKGKFKMDPVTDNAINELLDNGVDILYGLNYGNSLYERPDKPYFDIGPIYQEGHPFEIHPGPRTEEGRQAFVRYVDFVVRKYGNRIKWWELWNEENGWYPGHEPELYGKLLSAVARQIKLIDSDLKVMFGGTAAPAPLTTDIALREGAAGFIDGTAFHPYGIDKPEGGMGTMEFHNGENLGQSREQTGWNCLEEVIEGVRKPFYQHGMTNIDVWLNEWGTNVTGLDYTYNPKIGEYGCTKYMMRFYIYSGWLKVPAAWWALYNENKSQDWGILDQHDYGFRPMSYALRNVCSVVSDVEPLPVPSYNFDGDTSNLKVISYKRIESDEYLTLIWSAELVNEQVKIFPGNFKLALTETPENVEITDLYWGIKQSALYSYENDYLTISNLIVKDYPLVISYKV